MVEDVKPIYLRLRDLITASILDGHYRDGALLPSVRAFAIQHGANPLTVAKAYQSFQDDGLIIVRRGIGMFLAEGASRRLKEAERDRFLQDIWPPIAEQMLRLGIKPDELLEHTP